MSDDRKDLPSVTSDNFLQRVREAVQTYLGSQGDLLDRGVTLRDLSDAGLIDISKSYRVTRRGAPVAGPGPAVVGADAGVPGEVYTPDLTPPPTPEGFTLGAGISYLFIGCSPALYTQGHGHMATRVYGATRASGAPAPVFADAVVLTEFQGTVFAHATNPATTWHLWIKWVTRDGVESVTPAGGTNGLSATTGQDVSLLLGALTGQITQDQLYSDLGSRIDLIDGSGAGSVNARLAAQAASLQAGIDTVSAEVAAIAGTAAYDNAVAYSAGELVQYLGKLYRAKLGTTGNLPTNATYWELVGDYASLGEAVAAHSVQLSQHETRITTTENGLTAESLARDTLAVQLRGGYTGTDPNSLTTGLVYNERVARVTADSANAGLIAGVRSDLTTTQGTVAGQATAINGLTTRVTATEGSLTTQSNSITSLTNTINDPTTGLGSKASSSALAALTSTVTDHGDTLSSQASAITTLQSQVAGSGYDDTAIYAALSTEASTRATQTGELYAKYTVKVDVAGLISGYGLASTANNAAPTSSFGVRANSFFIAPPAVAGAVAPTANLYDGFVWLDTSVVPNVTRYRSGSSWVTTPPILPFAVQTTPTTVNGQAVPPGVYIQSAFIYNGTITSAKIGKLQVDDGHIANLSVGKLTAGSLAVGQYIQSTSYVPGTSGWRLNADGSAEFGSQYIRGKLTASQIDTRGLEIKDAAGNVILSSGSSLGAQVATTYGGGNLCQNSGFDSGTLDKWTGATGIDLSADWMPHGGHAAYAVQTSGTAYMEIVSANMPVKAGQRYEYHGKTGAHRCNVAVFIYWVNSANNIVGNTPLIYNLQEAAGGPSLNTWKHHGGVGVAPTGAVAARFIFRKDTTAVGYTDSYMFATQAYFGEAGANQTTFTPWAPSVGGGRFGALDKITSGNASTYIADLAVDTLQISNQAVTINQSATVPTNTGIYGTDPESEYSVISGFAVTSSGAPALLIISVIIYTNYISSDSSVTYLTVRVRDGTWGAQIAGKLLWGSRYSALPGRHPITLAIPVNLSAGTHYLQLTFGMAEDGINHSIFTVESGGTFTYLETKK